MLSRFVFRHQRKTWRVSFYKDRTGTLRGKKGRRRRREAHIGHSMTSTQLSDEAHHVSSRRRRRNGKYQLRLEATPRGFQRESHNDRLGQVRKRRTERQNRQERCVKWPPFRDPWPPPMATGSAGCRNATTWTCFRKGQSPRPSGCSHRCSLHEWLGASVHPPMEQDSPAACTVSLQEQNEKCSTQSPRVVSLSCCGPDESGQRQRTPTLPYW